MTVNILISIQREKTGKNKEILSEKNISYNRIPQCEHCKNTPVQCSDKKKGIVLICFFIEMILSKKKNNNGPFI